MRRLMRPESIPWAVKAAYCSGDVVHWRNQVVAALICGGWLVTATIFGVVWARCTLLLVKICAVVAGGMLWGLDAFVYW